MSAKECGEVFITPEGNELHCRIVAGHETGEHPDHACHDNKGFYKFNHVDKDTLFYRKFLQPGDLFPDSVGNTKRPS
jgi:hypothetical protein